ncbi:hypothetical protein ACI782_05960 [Geodermatophilus sp. SYSU D00703]
MAYLLIIAIAALVFVGLVLFSAGRQRCESIEISASLLKAFSFKVSLKRHADPGPPASPAPSVGVPPDR